MRHRWVPGITADISGTNIHVNVNTMRLLSHWFGVKIGPDDVDIEEDAAIILKSSREAVQKILARRAALDREGLKDRPLVVLLGEVHSLPAHIVRHMLIAEGLRKEEKDIVIADEGRHNALEIYLRMTEDDSLGVKAVRWLQDQDRKSGGALSLKINIGNNKIIYSRCTRQMLARYFLRSGIAFRSIDAAFKYEFSSDKSRIFSLLDDSDSSTAASIKACFNSLSSDIHVSSPEGLYARNHHMVHNVPQARIVILTCGSAHVVGNSADKYWTEHGLAYLFKTQTEPVPVLAMPVHGAGCFQSRYAGDHGLSRDEFFPLKSPPETRAIYETDGPIADEPATFTSPEAEADYMNELLRRVGKESECVSIDEIETEGARYLEEVREVFAVARVKDACDGIERVFQESSVDISERIIMTATMGGHVYEIETARCVAPMVLKIQGQPACQPG